MKRRQSMKGKQPPSPAIEIQRSTACFANKIPIEVMEMIIGEINLPDLVNFISTSKMIQVVSQHITD